MTPAKSKFVLIAVCLLLVGFSHAGADKRTKILKQKDELQQIQKQVREGHRKLDSLQRREVQLTHKVSEYDQKIASDRKIIQRLNKELADLKTRTKKARADLDSREAMFDRLQRRYLGSIRQFYLATSSSDEALVGRPNVELEAKRRIVYLTAVAQFEQSNVDEASILLADANQALDELSGKRRTVRSLKKRRETSVALGSSKRRKRQKDLEWLRRKAREEADRVMTLQRAAEEMEAIIARLERERQQRSTTRSSTALNSAFAALKGQLRAPCRGKIIAEFGSSVDKVTKLKSFNPGITIKGRPSGTVRAVASGTVAYAGNLRGYGNFIIINHDDQFYTTYAGLGEVLVSEGQHVQSNVKLGRASGDGELRFELRRGREPLDPVKWLRLDSF